MAILRRLHPLKVETVGTVGTALGVHRWWYHLSWLAKAIIGRPPFGRCDYSHNFFFHNSTRPLSSIFTHFKNASINTCSPLQTVLAVNIAKTNDRDVTVAVAVDALHGPTTLVVNLTGRLNSKVFAATCCGFAADRSVSRSSPPTPRTCPRRLGARQRLGHGYVSQWPAARGGPRLGVVDDRRSWRTRTTAPRGSTRWR